MALEGVVCASSARMPYLSRNRKRGGKIHRWHENRGNLTFTAKSGMRRARSPGFWWKLADIGGQMERISPPLLPNRIHYFLIRFWRKCAPGGKTDREHLMAGPSLMAIEKHFRFPRWNNIFHVESFFLFFFFFSFSDIRETSTGGRFCFVAISSFFHFRWEFSTQLVRSNTRYFLTNDKG